MTDFFKVCDICGMKHRDVESAELFARYRVDGIKDLCPECNRDAIAAWRKLSRITDGLLNAFVQRWLRNRAANVQGRVA